MVSSQDIFICVLLLTNQFQNATIHQNCHFIIPNGVLYVSIVDLFTKKLAVSLGKQFLVTSSAFMTYLLLVFITLQRVAICQTDIKLIRRSCTHGFDKNIENTSVMSFKVQ